MCFAHLEKNICRSSDESHGMGNKNKGIPLVRAVMSLYEGSKTKVKVWAHLSEEVEGCAGVHQASALSPVLCAIVIDVATNK